MTENQKPDYPDKSPDSQPCEQMLHPDGRRCLPETLLLTAGWEGKEPPSYQLNPQPCQRSQIICVRCLLQGRWTPCTYMGPPAPVITRKPVRCPGSLLLLLGQRKLAATFSSGFPFISHATLFMCAVSMQRYFPTKTCVLTNRQRYSHNTREHGTS